MVGCVPWSKRQGQVKGQRVEVMLRVRLAVLLPVCHWSPRWSLPLITDQWQGRVPHLLTSSPTPRPPPPGLNLLWPLPAYTTLHYRFLCLFNDFSSSLVEHKSWCNLGRVIGPWLVHAPYPLWHPESRPFYLQPFNLYMHAISGLPLIYPYYKLINFSHFQKDMHKTWRLWLADTYDNC